MYAIKLSLVLIELCLLRSYSKYQWVSSIENYYVVSSFRIELLILPRLWCPSFTTAKRRYVQHLQWWIARHMFNFVLPYVYVLLTMNGLIIWCNQLNKILNEVHTGFDGVDEPLKTDYRNNINLLIYCTNENCRSKAVQIYNVTGIKLFFGILASPLLFVK